MSVYNLFEIFRYAVVGVMCFRRNDPFHFGSIGTAMVSLFVCATFDGWTNFVFINYFGCNSQNSGVDGVDFAFICSSKQR
jgi:hypothetical protein